MKEVPFPVVRSRARSAKRRRPAAVPAVTTAPWQPPDPHHISVEERRRAVLRGRPVLFWNGGTPPA